MMINEVSDSVMDSNASVNIICSDSDDNSCDKRLLNCFWCHHHHHHHHNNHHNKRQHNKTKKNVATTPLVQLSSSLSTSYSLTTITPSTSDKLFPTLPSFLSSSADAATSASAVAAAAAAPISDSLFNDIKSSNWDEEFLVYYLQQNKQHLTHHHNDDDDYSKKTDGIQQQQQQQQCSPIQPPNSEFYIEEKINYNIYQSSNFIHQICYVDSYFDDIGYSNVCFNCNQIISTPVLDLSMYDNIQTRCGDCERRLCNDCIVKNNTNVCYCFLFRADTGCDKILCLHCSMMIRKPINIMNGIDGKSYISQSDKNTTYSFKCFFELAKKLFTNETLDRGPANALIRIINNFDDTNIVIGRDLLSMGIQTLLRDNEYPKTLAVVCFELARNELFALGKLNA